MAQTIVNSVSPIAKWQPTAATLKIRLLAGLFILDLLCVLAGFSMAAYLGNVRFAEWAVGIPALLTLYALTAFYSQAYAIDTLQGPLRAAIKGAQALFLSFLSVILIAYAFKASQEFSRLTMAVGLMACLGLLVICRYLFIRHLPSIIGGNPFSIILVHDGRAPIPKDGFSLVMRIDDFDPRCDDPTMYDRFAKSVASADRIMVACLPEQRTAWAHLLKGANVDGEILLPELAPLAPLGASNCGELPTAIVATGPLDLFDRLVKRLFDLTIASVVLLLLAPLLVVVAIAIKRDSPGPVLFRQTRIGRGNEMFQIMKFRTMRVEQSDGAGTRSTTRDDDRITRVGRFLRRTSMDELPQLFNVLKGDMSIVGPRPHALGSRAAEKLFWEVDGRYWHRHAAKPGMTGLAQIRGYRGATMAETDLTNRLQADLEYLERWSIWRDMHIILLTFRVLLHRNAF